MTKPPFRVVVIGGSIASLTLAHCLDQAGIDYVVLEKHNTVDDTPLGGFIALSPNGFRILAQLGLYAAVSNAGEPITSVHTRHPDGLGFPMSVLRRQELLRILYTSLKDRSKVHVGKRVAKIIQTDAGISVLTHDGSVYYGDIAVGADGVHSLTRSEGLQVTSSNRPDASTAWLPAFMSRFLSLDGTDLGAEYSGVVGISNGVSGIYPGDMVVRICDGMAIFVFGGKGTLIGWLVVQKLDRWYQYPKVPRFSQYDAINACTPLVDLAIRRNVKFGDVWAQRESFAMVALEEGFIPNWHNGRIACIGDSVNKMTPNMAQGANSAIEHAAALANTLHRLVASQNPQTRVSGQEITSALSALVQKRLWHMNIVNQASWYVTRVHARQGRFLTLFGRYVIPNIGWIIVHSVSWQFTNCVLLDYIPVTGRSTAPMERSTWTVSMILVLVVSLWIATLWLSQYRRIYRALKLLSL